MQVAQVATLAAVQQNGLTLEWASEKLRKDREVVLAAVRQNRLALDYASRELRVDLEIVRAAVQFSTTSD